MSRKGFILVLILGVGVKGAHGELSGGHVLPYVVTLGLGALYIFFTSYWSGRQRKKEHTEPSPTQIEITEPIQTGPIQTDISQTEPSQTKEDGGVLSSPSQTKEDGDVPSSLSQTKIEVVDGTNTEEPPTVTHSATSVTATPATATSPAAEATSPRC